MAYIGKTPITGNFVKLDAISVVNGQAGYTMNNGGSAFTDYENVNQFLVSLNGILQAPTTSFTVSGSTLTFASNLATGDVIDFVMVLGNTLDIGTPSDSTVTNAKTNFTTTSSSAGLQIKGDGTTAGALQLNCEQNSHGIKLQSPPHSANQSYSLKFPSGNVTAGKFLKVDSVSGSGTTGVGTMTFADAGGGKVLQVVTVSTESQVETTSTSYTAVSGMSLNITPAASSSKILLIHSANVQAGAGFYGYYTIYRDSTDISESHANRGLGSLYSSQGTQALPMHFSKLDSPSTTSQITYTVQFRSSSGSAMHYGEPDGTTTTLIAIEIGA